MDAKKQTVDEKTFQHNIKEIAFVDFQKTKGFIV